MRFLFLNQGRVPLPEKYVYFYVALIAVMPMGGGGVCGCVWQMVRPARGEGAGGLGGCGSYLWTDRASNEAWCHLGVLDTGQHRRPGLDVRKHSSTHCTWLPNLGLTWPGLWRKWQCCYYWAGAGGSDQSCFVTVNSMAFKIGARTEMAGKGCSARLGK